VLLADPANRDETAVTVSDGVAEQSLAQEDPLGMMPKGPMSKVRHERFTLIEPLMDEQVVVHGTTPAADAVQGVV
jgi:hypothetical protein